MGGPGSGRKKRPPGRPTKLTPELTIEIVRLIEMGCYYDTAAAACGISRDTMHRWMRDGARCKTPELKVFSDACKRADARAQAAAVERIRKAGADVWQADAWFLERKWPALWGRRQAYDVNMRGGEVKIYLPDNGRLPASEDDDAD